MVPSDVISLIKLLFVKDKELYVFIHRITGFYPRRIDLYQLAFVHRSKPVQLPDGHWANNERLEFLGDAVLDLVVADYLYNRYPTKHEGFLTSTRAKIVQRESLNRVGRSLHIDTHVRASSHSSSHNSYINGNAVEALVGAIYLDRGYDYCTHFIETRVLGRLINLEKIARKETNFKSSLLELCQKHHLELEFILTDEERDKKGAPFFRTKVMIDGHEMGYGKGYSKKESQQNASKNALHNLRSSKGLYSSLANSKTKKGIEVNDSDKHHTSSSETQGT